MLRINKRCLFGSQQISKLNEKGDLRPRKRQRSISESQKKPELPRTWGPGAKQVYDCARKWELRQYFARQRTPDGCTQIWTAANSLMDLRVAQASLDVFYFHFCIRSTLLTRPFGELTLTLTWEPVPCMGTLLLLLLPLCFLVV